jgi:hypothetical protein
MCNEIILHHGLFNIHTLPQLLYVCHIFLNCVAQTQLNPYVFLKACNICGHKKTYGARDLKSCWPCVSDPFAHI